MLIFNLLSPNSNKLLLHLLSAEHKQAWFCIRSFQQSLVATRKWLKRDITLQRKEPKAMRLVKEYVEVSYLREKKTVPVYDFKRQENRNFIDWFIAVPAKITQSGHQIVSDEASIISP